MRKAQLSVELLILAAAYLALVAVFAAGARDALEAVGGEARQALAVGAERSACLAAGFSRLDGLKSEAYCGVIANASVFEAV